MKIILIFCLLPFAAFAQQTALFETTIYVEDALGNIDSVTVGHDPEANNQYNPEFGEIDIDASFDSTFEVRAAHYLDFASHTGAITLSKKIIGGLESFIHPVYNCYPVQSQIALFIYAVHEPVTVKWKKADFEDSYCRVGSIITTHCFPGLIYEWWNEEPALALTACMAEDSTYTSYLFDYGSFGFYRLEQIEGQGLDTVFALLLTFASQNPSPVCTATVSSKDATQGELPLSFYPNPTTGLVFTNAEQALRYQVFDIQGKPVAEGIGNTVDLSKQSPGIYFILDKESYRTEKIIKLE